ncbi:hypothetical protein Kpol_1035p6 [Vanderwaltozyma polyspora DSM 70294]|uniref:HIT domain-containing protein n=1 Tax=Vanderwaltozyma polyspora (strain ATCC 22028 / DSM 70294 / BCRC 21397 / CBS 2163 / NBRC 10782 / NRRL Y-8283 / UCD 57-17) TaxID=436907 RepID=A7TKH2_VANPO|nr:uncharacterized protein Kpol_1035p6 [Vanderwaltozyma polyspora DSM 70294]EDO17194.1 hypothetical protein Kpol_1035p6 [Vanderwaltozyma polyspora DSM 70294]
MSSQDDMKELIELFRFEKILNSNPQNKLITVLGKINGENAIVLLEKLHFQSISDDENSISSLSSSVKQLFHNDVYFNGVTGQGDGSNNGFNELKVNLIYPATETHIQKQLEQQHHMIKETPEMYKNVVKPYIESMFAAGRLKWVENILYNGAESDRVVYQDDDMVILPDMKWDGENMDAFYLVSILKRKDILSLRDINKNHYEFLNGISERIKDIIPKKYNNEIKSDQLRIFIHYQPSYYHFHIHIVNIKHLGLGNGIVAGKAWLLDDIIDQLFHSNAEFSFEQRTLSYVIGENHELWKRFNESNQLA